MAIAVGQKHRSDPFLAKAKKFNHYLDTANNYQDTTGVNDKIAEKLMALLEDPRSVNYDLEKVIGPGYFGVVHSKDKRLWFFSWSENTGGSFQSNLSVTYFKTADNKPRASYEGDSGAGYTNVYELPSGKNKHYLCFSSYVGCGTCYTQIAQVVTLTRKNIIFHIRPTEVMGEDPRPLLTVDSRIGDITTFEYNAKSKILSYEYIPDDLTPIVRDEEDPESFKPVKGAFRWNGNTFVEIGGAKKTESKGQL